MKYAKHAMLERFVSVKSRWISESVWICDAIKQTQLVTNLYVSLDAAVRRDRLYVQVSQ